VLHRVVALPGDLVPFAVARDAHADRLPFFARTSPARTNPATIRLIVGGGLLASAIRLATRASPQH